MMKHRELLLSLLFTPLLATTSQAKVRMPALFTDNMILQRDAAVPVWGWADAGEKATQTFAGRTT